MTGDPWKNTALRNSYDHPGMEWPPNDGHKHSLRTMDREYYADEIEIDKMTGYPIWHLTCPGYKLHGRRLENAVIYEYEI